VDPPPPSSSQLQNVNINGGEDIPTAAMATAAKKTSGNTTLNKYFPIISQEYQSPYITDLGKRKRIFV
jgi:hypothetical protein